jgi:hypothetical protein
MATLLTITARVRSLLMDAGASPIWSDATITEGVRLALGEYALAGAAAQTLEGLDGAAVTSLPAVHESLLVGGAAAYAALARNVDRAESFQLDGEAGQLKSWADTRLKEYKAGLSFVFPGYLVVLAGQSAGGGSVDPLVSAAQAALLNAQAQAATGAENRAAAAAQQDALDRAAEAARLAELRAAAGPAWGGWTDTTGIEYPEDYDRT